ncbi:MAG: hypothetical protein LBK83_03010 [Treponema sp.]|jgi:hypothetical protein|nr:hypothetical protein [Treponema sp.]
MAGTPAKGLTFKDVWAMFQETDKKFKETDKQIQETAREVKETAREVRKTSQEIRKLSKNMGGMNRSLGELIETLMAGRLWEKFPAYNFNRIFQRIKLLDKNKIPLTEIDILLSDDDWAMAVEVKREPDKEDVEHHLKRMELMREYTIREISGKKLLGAIAGGVVSPEVRACAQKSGLFVHELNGEQVSLLESPEGFVPLEG